MNRRGWGLGAGAWLGLAFAGLLLAQARVYPLRWVYISRGLQNDRDVEDVRNIASVAAEHGLNGIALAAGLDRLSLQPAAYFDRLAQVKAIAEERGLEIVPMIFSAGYGGSILAHDRNLAEGLPVKDALFVAEGAEARLMADPPAAFANGGLEDYDNHRLRGWRLQDGPGSVSFIDTEVFHEGRASLRFENLASSPAGNARLMQEVAVRPHRLYRVSFWLKTEALEPRNGFRFQALAQGRNLAPWTAPASSTSEWRRLTWGFNSGANAGVLLYFGVWGGRGGKFWLDDLRLEEVGLLNVLRRPGTPLQVRSEDGETEYEEGRDYDRVADRQINFRFDHEPPSLRLPAGSRIQPGQRLRVSWYHGMSINDGQVTICMSEPRVYEIWAEQARRLHAALGARRYILSMDEIRMGGTCEACRARQLSMAEILGQAIRRQFEMLREHNPEADVWIWSDMLDPNHNARAEYYLVEGDYTGSWEHVPRELGIITWYYARRVPSLGHFSGLGFRTLAGAYYDGDTLDNPVGWLEALDATPGAEGIMYTTWENKYGLLAGFGDLVSQR